MIIKSNYESVDKAMATVASIVNDKMLQDDLKTLIIWVKDGQTRFVANNGNITSATDVEATVDFEGAPEGETFVQLRSKDVVDVLAAFKGLKRTKVTGLEFHIKEREAVLHVIEGPIDDNMQYADEYNQTSKYRITKSILKEIIKSEIQKIKIDVKGIDVESANALLFFNALLPTVVKETREGSNNVIFGDQNIYTVPATYAAIMPNKLPEGFSGFRLPNTVVTFLKNFVSASETFIFHKEELGNGLVILTLKNDKSVAVIKCADLSRAFDITNFVAIPENGIVIDKMYLIDVLKRININTEAVFVEVDMDNGAGSFKVVSKSMTQNVPVIRAKGSGKFTFSIRAELLSVVVFSHAAYFDENIFFYFETGDKNNIVMACTDNSQLWHTKMMGLTSARGDFAWG